MRLLVRWVLNAAALFGIAYFAPEMGILPGFQVLGFQAAVVAVAILAILNLTVGPVIRLLTLPITCLTFGLFTLIINALLMLITSRLVEGFVVGGFVNAVVASVLFSIVSTILNLILNRKKED